MQRLNFLIESQLFRVQFEGTLSQADENQMRDELQVHQRDTPEGHTRGTHQMDTPAGHIRGPGDTPERHTRETDQRDIRDTRKQSERVGDLREKTSSKAI